MNLRYTGTRVLSVVAVVTTAACGVADAQPQDYFFHADDLHTVMALTNAAGSVVERYEYDDFGRPEIATSLMSIVGNPSAVGNPLLYQGRRLDADTGLYYFRTRYLDSRAGRFTTRDTIGVWGDAANSGNGCGFSASNPATRLDPMGRAGADCETLLKEYKNLAGDLDKAGKLLKPVETRFEPGDPTAKAREEGGWGIFDPTPRERKRWLAILVELSAKEKELEDKRCYQKEIEPLLKGIDEYLNGISLDRNGSWTFAPGSRNIGAFSGKLKELNAYGRGSAANEIISKHLERLSPPRQNPNIPQMRAARPGQEDAMKERAAQWERDTIQLRWMGGESEIVNPYNGKVYATGVGWSILGFAGPKPGPAPAPVVTRGFYP